jgi:putative transposase
MARGFVYLVAVMDWFSRCVLAWRLSIGMDSDFCVEALTEAIARHGPPEIFNTDQGVPAHRFSMSWRREACGSAWTAKAGFSTTFSSNGCGAA